MEVIVKKELIKEVAEKLGKTQKETLEMYDTLVGAISDHIADGDTVKMSGFVTFDTQDVAEREARNPKTGEAVIVPAHKRVRVKVSSTLKNLVK